MRTFGVNSFVQWGVGVEKSCSDRSNYSFVRNGYRVDVSFSCGEGTLAVPGDLLSTLKFI